VLISLALHSHYMRRPALTRSTHAVMGLQCVPDVQRMNVTNRRVRQLPASLQYALVKPLACLIYLQHLHPYVLINSFHKSTDSGANSMTPQTQLCVFNGVAL
jgi:hypothetical protein